MKAHDAAELAQTLFEEMADAAFITDPKTSRLVDVNPMAQRLTGLPREELLRLPLNQLFRSEGDIGLEHLNRALFTTRTFHSQEGYFLRRSVDDAWIPVNLTLTRLHSERGPLGIVMARDISERVQAEEKLRIAYANLEQRVEQRTIELERVNQALLEKIVEHNRINKALRNSEELFRGAFEHTGVAMVLTDIENRFIRVNAAFARLFGYEESGMLGMTMAEVTHPDDIAASYAGRERLLSGLGHFFQLEKRYIHRNGDVFWGLTNVSLVRDSEGTPIVYVGEVQDITERHRAEEAVRQRSAELAEANRDLRHKNEENEMFVYSVSHDLRSPLVNLQGFSKELSKACTALSRLLNDESVPAEIRAKADGLLTRNMSKSLGFIQAAVVRLSDIIDALLRLSRAGRVQYQWKQVDVQAVVGRVIAALQGTINEKGAAVRVGELPPIWGDSTAIEQVFANLIGNALTYLDPTRPGLIELGARVGESDGHITYFVGDNGLGIPPMYHQKVFQVFQRFHTGVGSGSGMGLAIVFRIVQRHRGRVWVESNEREGSTFYFSLPTQQVAWDRV